MRFGIKLAVFLAVGLLVILGAAGFATYRSIRDTLIDEGKAQITTAASRFVRQLDEIEHQVAVGVGIVALDFALRQAVAERDRETVLSALRNHGRRVGASRMLLVETDGMVSADTARQTAPRPFAYPALLERARDDGRVATVAVIDGIPAWLVVGPVMAPDPIAFVAAVLPLDDELLARIRALTGLPEATGLVVAGADGSWRAASGPLDAEEVRLLPDARGSLPMAPVISDSPHGETILLAVALQTPAGSPAVAAAFFYPLSDALKRYDRLILVLLVGIGGGLVAAILGAWLIARGVAWPLEQLALYTRRIGAGDYAPPPPLRRSDEIGELYAALGNMVRAVADREARIRHQASHDPVTNLPNRQALTRLIEHQVAAGPVCLMVVALSRLDEIAHTVGHDIADRMLRDATARLMRLLGSAPIGCIGERSFAMLVAGCDETTALATAHRLIEAFDQPYREGELTIDAAVAVGVSMAPEHGTDADLLLRRAEAALHAALHAEGRAAIYQMASDPHRSERLSLMSGLRQALARGELRLFYQPKLDLRSGRLTGAEALVRWQHPVQGLIPNDAFIGLAEETGNIQHLTRWALETGLAEVKRWRGLGLDLRVSINISVRDLAGPGLCDRVAGLLRSHALPPEVLVLEVTEGAIMREPDTAVAVLRRLAAEGVTIAIDDFGVGQSSLTYLRRLPVGELKIDKDFVLRLGHDTDDQTIVRTVVELGHSLGFVVTAEGVQDEDSLRLLRGFGCDYAQGYLIARPLPPDEFCRLAEAWPQRGTLAAAAC
ncbi:MAG: EAL domain-containing protein [Acetobacteraceae bacterium]